MTDRRPAPDDDHPAGPSRRALLGGAAIAALAGAGAGAGVAALLHDDAPSTTEPLPPRVVPRLAAGSVPGGPDGPWHYVEPGGSIQEVIDGGAVAIQLGAGRYEVSEPIVPTPGCTIRGVGEHTRLVATRELDSIIAIGNGGPVGGVHLGDFVVDAAKLAVIGIDLDVVGTDGNLDGEPDAVCRLDNLWVLDAALDGVVYRGDTRATITTRVRVRRAWRNGFRVEAPDNSWVACEATTHGTEGAGFRVGDADPGSDGIGGGNTHFHGCKAWYCRGAGWHISSTRSTYVACEAQDVAGHGFHIVRPRNTFSSCVADTAAMGDVGGVADSADGFHVETEGETPMVACLSFDRTPSGLPAQQRWGFNVPDALVEDGLLVAATGWGNVEGLINRR